MKGTKEKYYRDPESRRKHRKRKRKILSKKNIISGKKKYQENPELKENMQKNKYEENPE